ncbi:MAG: SCP2 sterol-binding domain-containing protein [Gammaproteobacteria bacterium]|nr:SCP2 sterol-binding domain-containing protein [Gammaproteobacteria bacterium]
MSQKSPAPRLPRALTLPLSLLPDKLHGAVAAATLHRVFAAQRAGGELDFMDGKTTHIRVLDAGVCLRLTLGEKGFAVDDSGESPDLLVQGTAYDYLLLLSGDEDPDTLFFQRRLRMSGDTALGVHLKNFLASAEPGSLPLFALAVPLLQRGMRWFERVLG